MPGTKDSTVGPSYWSREKSSAVSSALQAEKAAIKALDLDEAQNLTKLPRDFLERMLTLSADTTLQSEHGLFFAVRIQDIYSVGNRIYGAHAGKYDPKDTSIASKSNPYGFLGAGNILQDPELIVRGYVPSDNSKPGSFAAECTEADESLAEALKQETDLNIQEVKMLDNAICYSANVFIYEKASKEMIKSGHNEFIKTDRIQIKHFIQVEDSLRRILNYAKKDAGYEFENATANYSDLKIQDGNLKFKYKMISTDGAVHESYIIVDLKAALSKNDFERINKISDRAEQLLELENLVNRPDQKEIYVPLFKQKSATDATLLPIMAHAGNRGYIVSPDADMQHVGLIDGLPNAAHTTWISKLTPPSVYLQQLDRVIKDLAASKYKTDRHLQLFRSQCIAAKEFYKQPQNTGLLQTIGTASVYDLVIKHYFNHALYVHSSEDSHPSAKPEKFASILSVWKEQIYVTKDEKSYLDFLFMDHDLLKSQCIGVHPYWLRNRTASEIADDGMDLTQYWIDAITIHALALYAKRDLKHALEYLDNLTHRITSVTNRSEVNALAAEKITKIKSFVQTITKDIANDLAEIIYNSHKPQSNNHRHKYGE